MLLAIDIGSTSIKSALVGDDRAVTAVETCPTPDPSAGPASRHETSAEGLLHAVMDVIQRRLRAQPDADVIAFSTQMHGALLADACGRPLTGYLSWQDERAYEPAPGGNASAVFEGIVGTDAIRRSGIPLRPGLPSTNLFAVTHGRDAWVSERGLTLHTLGSLIVEHLTGRTVTHLTSAAATGLVDTASGQWDPDLVAAVGIHHTGLPEIVASWASVGRFRGPHGLVEIYPDLGDQQATVAGVDLAEEHEVLVSVGTAGLVSRLTRRSTLDHSSAAVENRAGPRGERLLTVSRLPGGRAIDVFTNFIGSIGTAFYSRESNAKDLQSTINELSNSPDPQVAVSLVNAADRRLSASIEGILPATFTAAGLCSGLRAQLVDDYARAITALYAHEEKDADPTRILIVGGVSDLVGPWLEDELGTRFQCPTVTLGGGEIALQGLAAMVAPNPMTLSNDISHVS